MIIIKLWGGLGNQLFQYSYGYQLAKKTNSEMKLDISFYSQQTLRKPIILDLNLEYKSIISANEIPGIVRFLNKKNPNRAIRVLPYSCFNIGKGYKYFKETRHFYDERIRNFKRDNVYIDGYWQCPKYFDDFRNDLIMQYSLENSDFTNEQLILLKEISKCNSVAVHIRRGDYVNNYNPFSKLLLMGKDYYDFAIKNASSNIKEPFFYFFTNDVDWVKDNYGHVKNSYIVSGNIKCTDFQELILMSKCKNQIISNSTFSWWAAWLNDYNYKNVWTPSKGFGNRDIIPDEWKKIDP